MTAEIKKCAEVELSVENLAFGGRGIARADGMVIFVEGALPGDRVRAFITKKKSSFAEARTLEVLTPSPNRINAQCSVFDQCGGCTLQNFSYDQQLRYKQQHVEEALRHIGRQTDIVVHPIIPSPGQFQYRNKMELSFGAGISGDIEIGFHHAGNFRRIVNVEECHIQPTPFNSVLHWFRTELNRQRNLPEGNHLVPYDAVHHTGFLRHLVLRYSQTSGNFLVALLTASGKWNAARDMAERLMQEFAACNGFIWGINDSLSDVARMEKQKLQLGEGYIEEQLGQKRFRISTFSFFQTNTAGAKLLYDVVRDYAQLDGRQTVLDAYCGTGTIGIYLSDLAKKVIGIEVVKDAIWDARHNAALNHADNCVFLAGEMRDVLASLPQMMNISFDRVIIDPPRGGMDKKSLRLLVGLEAPMIVYVSCNPATLARDAATIVEAGYQIEEVQPVDMFPHTYHVESVLKLHRR